MLTRTDTPGAIAVVIPCYDLGATVEEALDSVLAQTRPAAEIVIVDDGSTDLETRQVLARLGRPRTRVVSAPHAGVAAARNRGVTLTSAPYLVLLDADDVLAERYLERLAARLDADAGLGFVSCAVRAFDGASYVWTPPPATALDTLTRGSVHVSTMLRRALWNATGGFAPELPAYEDLDFWLRAIRLGFRGEILDEPLLHYRVRANSRYHRGIEAQTYRTAMEMLLDRHRAVLLEHGIEALAVKEAFLLDLIGYQARLREQRDALRGELARLEGEIETGRSARAAWGGRGDGPGTDEVRTPPESGDAALRPHLERFLAERRWCVRGRVAVVSGSPGTGRDLAIARWDDAVGKGGVEQRSSHELATLPAGAYDCLVVVALAAGAPLAEVVGQAVRALRPGGTLLVAATWRPGGRGAEHGPEADGTEREVRAALARGFPLDGFEVEVLGSRATVGQSIPAGPLLVAACGRVPGGAPLPRVRWRPRASPSTIPPGGLVIAYHRIASLSPDTHGLCVAPSRFREHLRYLRERCTPLPLVDLLFAARDGGLPPRAVAITFDDGYLDALTTAAPMLADARIPATFFVNTERLSEAHEAWHDQTERILLGSDPLPPRLELPGPDGPVRFATRTVEERRAALMALHGIVVTLGADDRTALLEELARWSALPLGPRPERRVLLADEVLALSRMPGCEIGSHSDGHLLLPRHPAELQRAELRRAKACLEALLDRPVLSFAYPYGEHTPELAAIARSTPHVLAVTVEPGLVTASGDPFSLPRVEIPDLGAAEFAELVDALLAGDARRPSTRTRAWPGHREAGRGPSASGPEGPVLRWVENDRLSRAEHEAGRTVLAARPQFVIIDPTSRCNARCVMCLVSFRRPGDHGTDLDRSVFAKVADLIPTASHVNLFSSGEPTIARGMAEILGEAKRLRHGHAPIWVSTNGKRLPAEILEPLFAPGMGLQFSVDGGTPAVFEAIRRGITFDELCDSLARVQRRKGSLPDPALAFSSTISKRNVHDLGNIFALAERYGVGHVTFYEEDPEVPAEEPYLLDGTDRPIFEAQLPRIEATGVPYSNGLHFRGLDGLRAVEPDPPADPPPLRCRAPWKVFHVKADGTVRTCCTLRRSMGDLGQQTVEEVWNGEAYVRLRQAFVEQSGIPGVCYRCTDPLRTWESPPGGPAS